MTPYIVKYVKNTIKLIFEKLLCLFSNEERIIFYTAISHTVLFWFLVVIASIVAEHYTGNILSRRKPV
jgi:hypothetical protein